MMDGLMMDSRLRSAAPHILLSSFQDEGFPPVAVPGK